MAFQPLNNNVLVKVQAEDESDSAIVIPETAQTEKKQGEVLAVPPGGGKEVAVGDSVMFKRKKVTELDSDDDATYLVMPFKNIIGKFVETDKI